MALGSASRDNHVRAIVMVGGTLKSADGFSPAIEAEFAIAGQNFLHADSDGAHNRPDAHSILRYV
ncbi:hypothetical protein N7478_007805 [Penicillium angulare]|uniref:uncharacterized protein n=1 Tax=Penicillium angulare TaxID=116970 RepID=UPI002540B3A5|nr:uncharacterized protein N7478_007805 [Penicillium angulare]KAJ5272680.1 hypothetical protein N7478_007805 [Penicillium angulare]